MRKVLIVFAGFMLVVFGTAASCQALYCSSCGFGSKKDQCFKCGKPFAKIPARICDSCGFGSKKDNCVKCGKPFAKIQAHLCDSCGFGDKKNNCVKCGKHMFN